jgi:hypothetical protein
MKMRMTILVCGAAVLFTTANASAAIQFKRFSHCAEGLVTVKTCECHANTSKHWHFCHSGEYCHTFDGTCHK